MRLSNSIGHHAFEDNDPRFIPMLESGYPDLKYGETELDFMKEFKANNLMNNIMILLKKQPAFAAWWFTTMGSDQRERVMKEIQKLLLHELA